MATVTPDVVSAPTGEILKPVMRSFDPLADHDCEMQWEVIEGDDCPLVAVDSAREVLEWDFTNLHDDAAKHGFFEYCYSMLTGLGTLPSGFFGEGDKEELEKAFSGCLRLVESESDGRERRF